MDELEKIFHQQRDAEGRRYRNLMIAQINNAIIEIEDGDIDDAVARLKMLVGEWVIDNESRL